MAFLARYFLDDARKQVPKIVPCTLEQICPTDDARCLNCQKDLRELEQLLDNLEGQVDWAVIGLLVLAAMQLLRACSGGLFSRFGAGTDPLNNPLLSNSIWSTAEIGRGGEASFSWSRRQQPAAAESIQDSGPAQRRQKYTGRQTRNGGSRADFEQETLATGVAATGNLRPSFGGRFSSDR